MSLCGLLLSLETPNDVRSIVQQSKNIQATSKGSDQTARMHRLVGAFAGRTYHIVGNFMLRFILFHGFLSCRLLLESVLLNPYAEFGKKVNNFLGSTDDL